MPDEQRRKIIIETPAGERFEAPVPFGTTLATLAADFFEDRAWPGEDQRGRRQRAVVELVNPDNPDETKRLSGDQTIEDAVQQDGAVLRIFPESIAGVVDQRARLTALISDHKDMEALTARNPRITFSSNRGHAPDRYEITLQYKSFVRLEPGEREPRTDHTHRVEIILGADYPRLAPLVRWLTPIFHPNIRQTSPPDPEQGHGVVCLGVLQHRYLPALGLARLVHMLAEMVQWRNFDAFNAFNREAAEWAADVKNWPLIESIGGHPLQGPIEDFIRKIDRAAEPRIKFTPVATAR